ncbi:hypothetical protein GN956_G15601 [Arapaima gigas]
MESLVGLLTCTGGKVKLKEEEDGDEDLWLTKQPLRVVSRVHSRLGIIPLDLLIYTSQYLRVTCYRGVEEPPAGELLEKSISFLRQLQNNNWKLNFSDVGLPLVPDIQLPPAGRPTSPGPETGSD